MAKNNAIFLKNVKFARGPMFILYSGGMKRKKLWWRGRRRSRRTTVTQHYLQHKELAREHITARVEYWNQFYGFDYNRIAIRNQRTCWGSCSSNNNLNFSYKLLFLPERLFDYIIVHELCHLEEFNHSQSFWDLVGETLPDYKKLREELHNAKVTLHKLV